MINQLIEVIGSEAKLFESFLALLEDQKQALVTNDAESLTGITERLRERLAESRLLNMERERIVGLIRRTGGHQDDITLSQIVEQADERQAHNLSQLKELILGLHEQIEQTRNSNALLLNQSREFLSKTMLLLTQMNRPTGEYTRSGSKSRGSKTLIMDRRA